MPRLCAACIGGLIGLLLSYPQVAIEAARSACALWVNSVMPALFPYLVLSQLLAACLQNDALTIPLAMLGGSPAGARLISLSQVPKDKTQRLAALCATVSPLYILGTLQCDFRMLLAHWLGALVPWLCIRIMQGRVMKGERHSSSAKIIQSAVANSHSVTSTGHNTTSTKNIANMPQAIADAVMAMLSVCGCMVIFSVLSALTFRVLPLSARMSAFLMCVLEMAGGCAGILSLGLQHTQTVPLLCAAVSFGGFSIFLQNAIFLKKTGINLRVQFLARVLHACAAYGICTLLYLS